MREKITDLEGATALREALEREGRRLVFTNGCFDVLHAGHVRYLAQARALGDALVVGLNGDASVRALKGPGRPVNPESDRAEVLAALEAVDGVVAFPGERATPLIEAIRPHVYAKGGDYTPDSLHPAERAALDAAGTEIRILPLVAGRSTSRILAAARGGEDGGAGKAGARRPVRLGVLGSGKGSNFEAICAAVERGELDAEVSLVIADVPGAGGGGRSGARSASLRPGGPEGSAGPAGGGGCRPGDSGRLHAGVEGPGAVHVRGADPEHPPLAPAGVPRAGGLAAGPGGGRGRDRVHRSFRDLGDRRRRDRGAGPGARARRRHTGGAPRPDPGDRAPPLPAGHRVGG